MIEVCCALILSDDKILAVQRGSESSHPYLWEFPGGKIQENESAEQCIICEIEEELSVSINVRFQLEPVEFDYGIKQIRLIPFVCKIVSGEIILNEHIAQHWFCFSDWETIDWLYADRKLIIRNQETLKSLNMNIIDKKAQECANSNLLHQMWENQCKGHKNSSPAKD